MHGVGQLNLCEEGVYTGQFKEGLAHGIGILASQDGARKLNKASDLRIPKIHHKTDAAGEKENLYLASKEIFQKRKILLPYDGQD